jgi:hypothetical protein
MREVLEDGQREGRGLAGPGFGNAKQILPLGEERNGMRLDRRRLEMSLGMKREPQGLDQAEAVEIR